MTIIIIAIESVEIGMTAQSLSGTNISIAGIQVGCDGTVSDSMGRNYLIDSGCCAELSHQAINRATVQSVSLTTAI